MNLKPHAYGCPCSECRALVAAISAKNKDGSYFFSDDELEELLTSPDTPCQVEHK
jgi:hypothetical protein